MRKKICALVDAYGAAMALPMAFKNRGYPCIHIQSMPVLPPLFKTRFNPDAYLKNMIWEDNKLLLNQLANYELQCIIPGIEPGVDLADLLSEKFGLWSNGTQRGRIRRDKFLMLEALKEAGLAHAAYTKTNNLNHALNWANQQQCWPVVIKPLDSAGIDGLTICHNKNDVQYGFNKIIHQANLLGQTNEEVLLQEYLSGEEYVINSVSYAGQHFVTDIWRSPKQFNGAHGLLYDYEELIMEKTHDIQLIIDYTHQVLTALNIVFGPSHAELKLTPHGPKLIEVAARISGGSYPDLLAQAGLQDQIELTADLYTDVEKFLTRASTSYQPTKYVRMVILPSWHEGVIKKFPFAEQAKSLASLAAINFRVKVGDYICKTHDLNSSFCTVYLMHEDKKVVAEDYERLKIMAINPFVFE